MKLSNLTALFLSLLLNLPVAVASDRSALDELLELDLFELTQVSIATGVKQPSLKAPSVVTVITAKDIENMGARDVDEVLNTVAGFNAYYGNFPAYILRGLSSLAWSPEVLVLINGIRLNQSQTGDKSVYWGGLPIHSIARIEVIRGPGSALYGADAFAGVINIITKQAQEIDGNEVGVRVGNFNTRDGWLLHGTQWNEFDIAATVEFATTDGHGEIIETDSQTLFDTFFDTNASYAPGPVNAERNLYNLRLDISRGKWQFRTGAFIGRDNAMAVTPAETLTLGSYFEEKRFDADLTYHDNETIQNWDFTAQISFLQSQFDGWYELYPPGTVFAGTLYPDGLITNSAPSERRYRIDLTSGYSGFANHLIRFGTGYVYDDLYEITARQNFGINPYTGEPISPTSLLDVTDTPVASPEAARKNWYFFVQDTWTLAEAWELTAGIRYDHYSDFGSTTNPRLGLVWSLTPALAAKLLYGRAFRAPSFAELYNNGGPLGNPNLKPEIIDTWELVFDYQYLDFYSTLNLYTYEVTDKIGRAELGDNTAGIALNRWDNVDVWKGHGLEFEMRWLFSRDSGLTFNYAYQDSENDVTGEPLGTAPKHQVYLRSDWGFAPLWSLHGQMTAVLNWERQSNDLRDKVDNYAVFDLMLRRKDLLGNHTGFSLGVRNLFDQDVRMPSFVNNAVLSVPNDYPQAGRNFFAEFRYYF